MAFRLPSQKKFKPNSKVVPRKASIPASLAKQPSSSAPAASGTSARGSSQLPSTEVPDSPAPATSTQDDGLPPSIGSTEAVPPVGSSQPASSTAITQPSPVFREPSLPPPSRKRAASPTPSNASKSSRTGGRPTMIHLAASSGPARRPTASPSPAPPSATIQGGAELGSATAPSPSVPSASLPRVSPSPQRNTPTPKLSAPRPLPRATASPAADAIPTPPVQSSNLPSTSRASVPARTVSPERAPSEPSGMPPMVGSSSIDPSLLDQTPGAGPSREETARLAKALVAGIASQPAPPKRKRLTKMGTVPRKPGPPKGRKLRDPNAPPQARRKQKDTSAASESASQAEEGARDNGEEDDGAPKRKRPYKPRPPRLDENGNPIPRKPRGPNKPKETDKAKEGRSQENGEDKPAGEAGIGEVDEFAEDIPIDPDQQTMGSFTRGFYAGDMTERARILKDAQKLKRDEAFREKQEFERQKHIRLQPLRRRERAKRNQDRARRRIESELGGQEDEEVSEDEVDSTDEEYEFEPDRLTPPGTPEPENYNEEAGEEGQEGGEQVDEEQEGLGDVTAYPEDEDEEVNPEEQDEGDEPQQDVNLADYGFNVGEEGEGAEEGEGQPRDPNEADPDISALFDINPDEGDQEYEDGGQPGYSYADYAANMEVRRAAALATTNSRFVYTEDDDETRMINSTSWSKREKTDKWTDDETDFFYSVLSEVGENYGLMKAFFPGRTINQIKRKGLRENAKNPEKVTKAIFSRKPIDNQYLQKSAGYDPDRPWDAEEALFAEAKRDMAKLRAEDRGEDYQDEMVGEPDFGDDHGDVGNETMEMDGDGGDQDDAGEQPGEPEPAEDDIESAPVDNNNQNQGEGALFLPGGEDHASP